MSKRTASQAGFSQKYRKGNVKRRRYSTKTTRKINYPVGEKKGVDISLGISPILATTNTNGSSVVLNLIAPGNGSYNRVGRKIKITSVRLRGIIEVTLIPDVTTALMNGVTVRMVVVYDKQPSGVLPTFDQIFGLTDQTGTEATTYLDPIRYDNMDRFQVLRDSLYTANPQAASDDGTTNAKTYDLPFDEYIKVGRSTNYGGQSSPCTIADISSGGLYVYFRTDNEATSVSSVKTLSYARLRYFD